MVGQESISEVERKCTGENIYLPDQRLDSQQWFFPEVLTLEFEFDKTKSWACDQQGRTPETGSPHNNGGFSCPGSLSGQLNDLTTTIVAEARPDRLSASYRLRHPCTTLDRERKKSPNWTESSIFLSNKNSGPSRMVLLFCPIFG